MEIKVGMYVRTIKGIAKVKTLDDLDNVAYTDKKDIYFGINRPKTSLNWYVYDDCTVLIEPSYNIIDLIEVGDYVNGYKVGNIEDNGKFKVLIMDIGDNQEHILYDCFIEDGSFLEIREEQIKSILTKEQFESMAYKVGD